MRRISLALALASAVAATGCGGGAKKASDGGAKGTAGVNFSVTINNQGPGSISDGTNTCAPNSSCTWTYSSGTDVVLAATVTPGNYFNGWFGDCSGTDTCKLSGSADKYVVSYFSGTPQAHPNWAAKHGNNIDCAQCHGSQYQGVGLAPSCTSCHANKLGGHFDATAAAWSDHENSSPCYRCHTTVGFQNWVGLVGTAAYLGSPAGTYVGGAFTTSAGITAATGPLKCTACHNTVTDPNSAGITQILFPSGVTVTTDKVTALCGQCHMARESTVSVNTAVAAAAGPDAQIATAGVSFKNPHYRGAAATIFGSVAQGWAQYPGAIYTGQNLHAGVASCNTCHDVHNGDVAGNVSAATCGKCHFKADGTPVASFDELKANRQYGFAGDIDGDGTVEPLDVEIAGLQATLLAAIQSYAVNVAGQAGVCYADANYPYFLKHTGASGDCTPAEITAAAAYKAFTPRLMRAAYNYKFSMTDTGAWAHNPRYAIEILYDAITDLNAGLSAAGKATIPFSGFRTFSDGHFGEASAAKPAGSDAFSDWNAAGVIDAACSQCHGGQTGLTNFIANQVTAIKTPSITGFQCTTCHAPVTAAAANFKGVRTDITTLYFPPAKADPVSAKQLSFAASTVFAAPKDRVCATCHTGRENMTTVDLSAVGKTGWTISFKNPHYLGAAGVMFGSNAHMMYEYAGKLYAGYPEFWQADVTKANGPFGSPHAQSCTSCHNPQGSKHSFEVDTATSIPAGTYAGAVNTKTCDECHVVEPYGDFRLPPLKANVQALSDMLYATIQAYGSAAGHPVCYSDTYPYWFGDTNANGVCDASEAVSANGAKLDFAAAKAAYNYKWSKAEPGAYAHNYNYMVQALIDSILDLNPAATLPLDAKTGATIARP